MLWQKGVIKSEQSPVVPVVMQERLTLWPREGVITSESTTALKS
jgi:hypothetical protein